MTRLLHAVVVTETQQERNRGRVRRLLITSRSRSSCRDRAAKPRPRGAIHLGELDPTIAFEHRRREAGARWRSGDRRENVGPVFPRWLLTTLRLTPVVAGVSALSVVGLLAFRQVVPFADLAGSTNEVGNYLQTVGGILRGAARVRRLCRVGPVQRRARLLRSRSGRARRLASHGERAARGDARRQSRRRYATTSTPS